MRIVTHQLPRKPYWTTNLSPGVQNPGVVGLEAWACSSSWALAPVSISHKTTFHQGSSSNHLPWDQPGAYMILGLPEICQTHLVVWPGSLSVWQTPCKICLHTKICELSSQVFLKPHAQFFMPPNWNIDYCKFWLTYKYPSSMKGRYDLRRNLLFWGPVDSLPVSCPHHSPTRHPWAPSKTRVPRLS